VDGSNIICTGHGTTAFKIEKDGDGFTAKELWNNATAGTQFNTPVLKDGKLYGLSSKQNFFCMDAQTGKVLWSDSASHGQFGSIVDAGSVLMALTQDGKLAVLKPNDKQIEEVTTYKVADGGTFAHPVIVGSRIYIKDKDSLRLLSVSDQAAS
jgi:outer membrane protein assembly factor BamB